MRLLRCLPLSLLCLLLWAGTASAAFTVTCTSTSVPTTGDPDYIFNLPASIAAGELIVGCLSADSNWTTATWPSPWVSLSFTDAASVSQGCAYLFATGGETAVTVTRTGGSADEAGAILCRVQGAHASTPPEIGAHVGVTGEFPNPASVTASWGTEANLFIVALALNGITTIDSYPTGYTNGVHQIIETTQAGIALARKEATAATDDPGTFDLASDATTTLSRTIVVRPAASTGLAGSLVGGQLTRGLVGGGLAQ